MHSRLKDHPELLSVYGDLPDKMLLSVVEMIRVNTWGCLVSYQLLTRFIELTFGDPLKTSTGVFLFDIKLA